MRLFRPFDVQLFSSALPASVKAIAVLDRTKEPGSSGEPLYLDCVNALQETSRPDVRIVGGRYGLSSKEFTPAMIKAAFDNLNAPEPKNDFTVGIRDDVTNTSLELDQLFQSRQTTSFVRFSMASDRTVRSVRIRNRLRSSVITLNFMHRLILFMTQKNQVE